MFILHFGQITAKCRKARIARRKRVIVDRELAFGTREKSGSEVLRFL